MRRRTSCKAAGIPPAMPRGKSEQHRPDRWYSVATLLRPPATCWDASGIRSKTDARPGFKLDTLGRGGCLRHKIRLLARKSGPFHQTIPRQRRSPWSAGDLSPLSDSGGLPTTGTALAALQRKTPLSRLPAPTSRLHQSGDKSLALQSAARLIIVALTKGY